MIVESVGRTRVRGAVIRTRGTRSDSTLPGDALVLAHRRLPNGQLFFQAGARMVWRGGPGGYYPEVGDDGATSVPGLYAVGSAAGAVPDRSTESAERAVAGFTGGPAAPGSVERFRTDGPHELEGYYRELLAGGRRGRWIACPCEDVLLAELEATTQRGYCGIEVAKRYTGLGTGLCQGRYCLPDALLLLALAEGRRPAEVGYITQRPPVHPTPIAALAALDPGLDGTDAGR